VSAHARQFVSSGGKQINEEKKTVEIKIPKEINITEITNSNSKALYGSAVNDFLLKI
jgi:hypothetical protein